jgi:L-lactate dehydrogenase complex protein LldE
VGVSLRVSFFAGCVADRFFAEAAADAVRLLRHLGAEVVVPHGLTCCGQPAYNAGHRDEAVRLARHTVEALRGADHVVLPSGSCAGMIRAHLPGLLEGPGREAAEALAPRSWELSAFLVRVMGVERLGDGLSGTRVAYHHGCHALRHLGVHDEPIALLRGAGAEVVDWEAGEECCGFGGLFSAKLPEVSAAMADRKLDTLASVDLVTSADGGCLLQLGGRAKRRGIATPFRHLASVLWDGIRRAAGGDAVPAGAVEPGRGGSP